MIHRNVQSIIKNNNSNTWLKTSSEKSLGYVATQNTHKPYDDYQLIFCIHD